MTPLVLKYPLDLTGNNPNNLVAGEVHDMVRRKVRAIAPSQGAFYKASLRVIDTATNKLLESGTQYVASELIEEPTTQSGKEVCSIILITDQAVSDQVTIQYQCVGDKWTNYAQTIQQLIAALELDDRPVSKDAIQNWPAEFPPAKHLHDVGDTYGWEYVVHALNRVLSTINTADAMRLDAIYAYIDQVAGFVSPETAAKIRQLVDAAMAEHLAAADPHHQYLLRTEAESLLIPQVRKPTNLTPAHGAKNTGLAVTLDSSPFYSLYGTTQLGMNVRVSKNPGGAAPYVIEQYVTTGDMTQYQPSGLEPLNTYFWQVQYRDADGVFSPWSDATSFETGAVFVNQPVIGSPTNGAEVVTNGLTITGSNFATTGASDTHRATDWEIWTGPNATGTKVFSSYNDTTNKISITVPAGTLPNNATYYPRVKHYGTSLGASQWSSARSFSVKYPPFPTVIGESWGGGYYAGDVTYYGKTYAIILASKQTQVNNQRGDTNGRLMPSDDPFIGANDPVVNTTNLLAKNSELAQWARGLTIGGYNDWQIPSSIVMQKVYETLGPERPGVPAAFKKNIGNEQLSETYYWTSTAYEWIRDDSYCEGGEPIYEDRAVPYSYSGSSTAGPHGASGTIEPGCAYGEDASVDSYSFEGSGNYIEYPDGTREEIGYHHIEYTCSGVRTEQVVVGYEPEECYDIRTPVYDALAVHMGNGSVINTGKQNLRIVRAVRMVQKS